MVEALLNALVDEKYKGVFQLSVTTLSSCAFQTRGDQSGVDIRV